jgi:hypothetical protein
MDLRVQGIALQLRWLWLQRMDQLWVPVLGKVDPITVAFFPASTRFSTGDGKSFFFWIDPWLDDVGLAVSTPDLYAAIPSLIRRARTVADVLHDNAWIHDIRGALTVSVLVQYVELRHRLQGSHWTT